MRALVLLAAIVLILALVGWIRHGKWTWSGAELQEKPLTGMPVL
jgi:hypothetical protein